MQTSKKYDVVIIGGGMAGLSAAEYLVNNGVLNVAVLEAKNRLGGRIHTLHLPTGPVEDGAQWIHGAHITNNIYNFANFHKLINEDNCSPQNVIFLHNEGAQDFDDLYEKIVNDLNDYEENQQATNRQMSLENFLNNAFEAVTSNYSEFEKKYARPIFNSLKVSRIFHEGYDLDKISSVTDYLEIHSDIEINHGNDRFIEILRNNIGDQRILLNHEVSNISWNKNDVVLTVHSDDDNEDYEFKANYVISTIPLGVLKNSSSALFTPNLPQRKLDAINRLVFGKGVKIHLYYEKPFWQEKRFKKLDLGFTDERYAKGRNEWIHRISEFYITPKNPNVLLTAVFGKIAEEVELLSNEEIGHQITLLLRNYIRDKTITEPNKVYKSNWIHDKHTLGVYAGVSTSCIGNEFHILGEPLPETGIPRLLFAGEATVPLIYSTMHGARHSGVREAIRVVQLISKN